MIVHARTIQKATRREWIRFFNCVVIDLKTQCWNWSSLLFNHNGYGRFCVRKTSYMAHRYSYTQLKSQVDPTLTIDHLCRNRKCVNPDHMEPVTIGVNTSRGSTWDYFRNKTHCPQGHEYNEANTYKTTQRNGTQQLRRCRICNKESVMRSYHCRKGHQL